MGAGRYKNAVRAEVGGQADLGMNMIAVQAGVGDLRKGGRGWQRRIRT